VDIWIKVDTGYHRAGIDSGNVEMIHALAQSIRNSDNLKLRGLLTHAGQTYHAKSPDEIKLMYAESCQSLVDLNQDLRKRGVVGLELSVGDTPGCWLSADLGKVDEIRPGNFIFFDAMMMDFGVCTVEDIALAVACPVVALHPERGEVVIYGGAVHLSKDVIEEGHRRIYGYTAIPRKNGWDFHGRENYVKALSQEHGIVCLEAEAIASLKVGDLLYVLPVHSCLAVDALGEYMSNQGLWFRTMKTQ
jgi:D-serine deaminase-like pyridoxal phosphate-dependent protein